MSFATITGVLKDAFGIVIPNQELLFEATKTSETVLNNTSAKVVTDSVGGYSVELNFGTYTLKTKQVREASYKTVASNILVYSTSYSGKDLQFLLLSQADLQNIDQSLIDQLLTIKIDVYAARDETILNAQEAVASKTNAAASATSANSSANAAASSATSASSSASSASSSATSASSSASSASSSATSATSSKNAAATSATNAATSATNAATSATNAATSASNAATSATLAGNFAASLNAVVPYTPAVNPTLDLDFAKQKYKWYAGSAGITESNSMTPLITFSRSSTATYFDAMGVMQQAAVDTPRIDYDPATGECKGLLIEEQRTNLFTYTTNIGNTGTVELVVDHGATISPDGLLTAKKLTPSLANTNHYIGYGIVSLTGTFTWSIYVKAAGYNYISLRELGTTGYGACFNLATGTIVVTSGSCSPTITPVGNGWYRCSITVTLANQTFGCSVFSGTTNVYTETHAGDGVSGIYIWGFQLETGSFPTSYIPTPATFTGRASTKTYFDSNGVMQTAASGVAATDYGYVDGRWVSKGLSLEGQATNLLRQSGNLTTLWGCAGGATTAAGGVINFAADTNSSVIQSVTPVDGTYTLSARFSLADAGKQVRLCFWASNADGLTTGSSAALTIPADGRVSYTRSDLIGITNVGLRSPTGVAQTLTLYAGSGVQLETGPVATSYIPTTTAQVTRAADTSTSAQVTRAADNAVISGANFSQWYKQYEGAVLLESVNPTTHTVDSSSVDRGCAVISDSTDTNRIRVGGDAGIAVSIRKGGTDQSLQTVGSVSVGKHKTALSFVANNINAAIDAVSATQDVSAAIPYLTQLNIGKGAIAGGVWNGHIRSLKYYPKALSSIELQAMTA